MIKWITKMFAHRCSHDKLIVSMYWSFNTRKCIYECKCGHRKEFNQNFDWIYPHPTACMISYTEFKQYLTMSPLKTEYYYKAYGFEYAYKV